MRSSATWLAAAVLLASITLQGYKPALPGYEYSFPRDHFEHKEFASEWWYYTGNLFTESGRRFGFELTFFRQAVDEDTGNSGVWGINHLYLAHLTLTDFETQHFYQSARLNRAGPGLAGASVEEGRIWNGNWEVGWIDGDKPKSLRCLQAISEDFTLNLDLVPGKAPVIHGIDGVSQKSQGEGNASHYVSFTRIRTEGTVTVDGAEHSVIGAAWMDHEFFTNSLSEDQVGWDWMSVQLADNTELMIYRLRTADGRSDAYSSGTFVDRDGSRHLEAGDIELVPGETWTSPDTGGVYPIEWTVRVPSLDLALRVSTQVKHQEVVSESDISPSYWEGAVDYEGQARGKPVRGVGYLEMTGYDKPIELPETRRRSP